MMTACAPNPIAATTRPAGPPQVAPIRPPSAAPSGRAPVFTVRKIAYTLAEHGHRRGGLAQRGGRNRPDFGADAEQKERQRRQHAGRPPQRHQQQHHHADRRRFGHVPRPVTRLYSPMSSAMGMVAAMVNRPLGLAVSALTTTSASTARMMIMMASTPTRASEPGMGPSSILIISPSDLRRRGPTCWSARSPCRRRAARRGSLGGGTAGCNARENGPSRYYLLRP